MQTKTYNVYKFDELSEKAKKTAIDNLRESAADYEWWEYTYEDASNIGLEITSFGLDRSRHAEGQLTDAGEEVARTILKEHGNATDTYRIAMEYMQEYAKIEPLYLADDESFDDLYNELNEELLKDLLESYSIDLQNESEYLTSDEAITETIQANDYDFTEDGKLD